ncbi:hypothetical protein ACVNS2_12900 [Paenibacillus caseinilyticus]|uniref:hypothetical protein n=1 Tax=Paenibacillus mucilaginosus TaxID=61624 RepID=UPI0019D37B77|nr:hypothetical protein [Paenibacillus mucilaginosus]
MPPPGGHGLRESVGPSRSPGIAEFRLRERWLAGAGRRFTGADAWQGPAPGRDHRHRRGLPAGLPLGMTA